MSRYGWVRETILPVRGTNPEPLQADEIGIYKCSYLNQFLSADTIIPDPINPQGFNRFAYARNNPARYIDPSGHDAECWTSDRAAKPSDVSCIPWVEGAVRTLQFDGGADGGRLAALYWSWKNNPNKLLLVFAYDNNPNIMSTHHFNIDMVAIHMGWEVVTRSRPNEIALFGHELEHIWQGQAQAWSIQGEIMAYQTEYRLRASIPGATQSPNTDAAMLGDGRSGNRPYDPYDRNDLLIARHHGFLDTRTYNRWYEPNWPWGREIPYQISRACDPFKQEIEKAWTLITDLAELISN